MKRIWHWRRAILIALTAALLTFTGRDALRAQAEAPTAATGVDFAQISEPDIREWLTYLSSDALMGRAVFTEGYGMAAAYVAEQLRRLGVEPLGENGSYFQPVARQGYRVTRNSSVTVRINGETRTFTEGEHVSFPQMSGAAQTLEFAGINFVGYGLPPRDGSPATVAPGRLVVLLPGIPRPPGGGRWSYPATLLNVGGRSSALVDRGAAAVIGLGSVPPPRPRDDRARAGRATPVIDLTTVQHVDRPRAPTVTADETFLEFLLQQSAIPFQELRARANRGEALEPFALPDVHVTVKVNHTYELVKVERTNNVVGVVRGSDPVLRDTYVFFGAHLDHVGAATGDSPPGVVNAPIDIDPIWNGADDDGSGVSGVLAIAKAMAEGPRPKRSTVFVWHAGEEEGLLGSELMADSPVVPLESIQAVLNIDMIGRNHRDDPAKANTVFVIGADRISTDLHNLLVAANARMPRPLTLDYFYNDPDDSESFYTRSDHYSYASRGVPIAFFFTGTHPDYHSNTDSVDKILFPKLVRITQLIYEAGFSLADSPLTLRRDNRGSRSGRDFQGTLSWR